MTDESFGSTGTYYNYRYGRRLMDSRQQQYVTEVFGRHGCRADDVCEGFTVSETSFIPYEWCSTVLNYEGLYGQAVAVVESGKVYLVRRCK